jgi:hypothetical protein
MLVEFSSSDVLISIALPLNHLYYSHYWDAPLLLGNGMSEDELTRSINFDLNLRSIELQLPNHFMRLGNYSNVW